MAFNIERVPSQTGKLPCSSGRPGAKGPVMKKTNANLHALR